MSEFSPSTAPDVHAFLAGVSGDTVQFGSSYMPMLERALRDMDPVSVPDTLAAIILDTPLDNEAWLINYNVQAGFAERLYPNAALTAFAQAATDLEVANALVTRLEAADAEAVAGRMPLISKSLHERIMATSDSSIAACIRLSVWALQQFPPQDQLQQHEMVKTLTWLSTDDISAIQSDWRKAGYTELSD